MDTNLPVSDHPRVVIIGCGWKNMKTARRS